MKTPISNKVTRLLIVLLLPVLMLITLIYMMPEAVAATTAEPIAVMAPESFEQDVFPPAGWQLFRIDSGDGGWMTSTEQAFTGGQQSVFHNDEFRNQDSWLVLPLLTPQFGSRLLFQQYQRYPDFYNRHSVYVSAGEADPKANDYQLLAELPVGTENQWTEVSVDLRQYAEMPVYIAIRYEGTTADEWYVDDVMVTGDLGVGSSTPTVLGETTWFTASLNITGTPTYQWAFGDGTVGSGVTPQHTYTQSGLYTAAVTATVGADHFHDTEVVLVQEAITDFQVSNSSPTTPGDQTVLSATIATGEDVVFSWDLGNGASAMGQVVTVTYPHGIYTATATAMNAVSNISATTHVSVELPIEGLAVHGPVGTPFGEATTYSITISSGTNVNYTWNLGDGTTMRGRWSPRDAAYRTSTGLPSETLVISHTYQAIGDYTAVFTASNILGDHVVSHTLGIDILPGVPLEETSFEMGIPSDWFTQTAKLNDAGWMTVTDTHREGKLSAFHDDGFDAQDSWLVLAQVTPTRKSELIFWQWVKYTHELGTHSVWVSTGQQDPKLGDFEQMAEIRPNSEQTWEEIIIDLSPYDGEPIYLAMRYEGSYSAEWAIDDLRVTTGLVGTNNSTTALGQATTMTATLNTGSRLNYSWELGNGETRNSRSPVLHYTYPEPGDYIVNLTASNSLGMLTDTMTVTVRAIIYIPIVTR